jgi:pimeloyl-ACP methyl ester carboxylesterase
MEPPLALRHPISYRLRSSVSRLSLPRIKNGTRALSQTPILLALKAIDTPVLVVDGDHDEAIKRAHTEYIAATIPHAGLLILPNVSHFALLQDPDQFNFAILHFLGDE